MERRTDSLVLRTARPEENGDLLFYPDRESYLRERKNGWARDAKPEDCQDIYRLVCQLENTELPYEDFAGIYCGQLEDGRYKCAVWQAGGQVAGMANLRLEEQLHHCGRVAEVLELVVEPSQRGKGIGGGLLQWAAEYAAEHGCVLLEVACGLPRSRSHRFYLREGMEKSHYRFSRILP